MHLANGSIKDHQLTRHNSNLTRENIVRNTVIIRKHNDTIRLLIHQALWHMPHGIDPLATPKNNYSYYMLCEQPSPARIHSFTQHPFLLLQMLLRQE